MEYIKNDRGFYFRGYIAEDQLLDVAAETLRSKTLSGEELTTPSASAKYLQMKLAGRKNEAFLVMFLSNRHKLIRDEIMFQGTIDGSAVYCRPVVQRALELNASAVILAHNHPSGHLEPSHSDRQITKRLKEALQLVDVRVLDHIIVSHEGYTSMVEIGAIA